MKPPAAVLRVETEISTATVRPGDKLIVACKPPLLAETAARIIKAYERQLPGVEVVPIETEQMLVYRPDEIREVDHAQTPG